MSDIHLKLFTPLIEMLDSLDSARVTAKRSKGYHTYAWYRFWKQRSAWHLANAIGWASR